MKAPPGAFFGFQMITLKVATITDVSSLLPLFNAYRDFYGQKLDAQGSESFLEARINNRESIIFLAHDKGKAVGFTQLYTTFSSVSLQPVYILNDLYVLSSHRAQGIGAMLLQEAKNHCIASNFKGLALETAIDNPAQALYERLGWKKDSHCFHYFWNAP